MGRFLSLGRARRGQRGAVLVMAVPATVLAMIAMALSVDIGRQALEKRDIQGVADLAALDAARDLGDVQAAAEASAARNGFDVADAENTLLAERGAVAPDRTFTVDPAGDAVRVTVTSVVDYIFRPGSQTLKAVAVGQRPGSPPPTTGSTTSTTTTGGTTTVAGFTLGSTLAAIDTSKAALLNKVLGGWLKGAAATGGTVDVVGWQGLLDSEITLEALRGQLELLDAGVQFGTVDQLLTTDVTLAELAQATANALNAAGDADAALYAGPAGIVAQSTSTATFQLGKLFSVATGAGDAALATQVNAWDLLVGSAMVANGTNLLSVPDAGITIPGLGTTSLAIKVIEAKKTYIGPAGGSVSTSQVELTLTPTLDRPLTVLGLAGARLTGSFPLTVTSAGATGTLSSITCSGGSAGVRVTTDLKALSASTSATLGVSATVLFATVPVASVSTSGGLALADPTSENVDFAYPAQFTPTSTGKRVGSAPLGLSTSSAFTANVTSLGVLTLPVNLGLAVQSDLKVVAGLLDEHIMKTLHETLGISVGVADVAALKDAFDHGCANPIPSVTTTTTTTTAAPTTTTTGPPKLVG